MICYIDRHGSCSPILRSAKMQPLSPNSQRRTRSASLRKIGLRISRLFGRFFPPPPSLSRAFTVTVGSAGLETVRGVIGLPAASPRIPVTGGGTQPWRGLGRAFAAHLHNDFFGAGWPVFVGRERECGPEAEGRRGASRR
jgi:hypothetical protein